MNTETTMNTETKKPSVELTQSERDRQEVKISKATNGYIVKVFPNFYVFKEFGEMMTFLKLHFENKKER